MKKIVLAFALSLFTACSSITGVDKSVILIGECKDEQAKMRLEIYIRALPIDDTSKHLPSVQDHKVLSDEETLHVTRQLAMISKQKQAEAQSKEEQK